MKKLVVLGAGESGLGAAMLARQKGYVVLVSEYAVISPERRAKLEKAGIEFEEKGHSLDRVLEADLIVKSPGISPKVKAITKAKDAGIPIIDELEFAFQFSKGKVIAITGTNGKTTTASLIYHLLKSAGKNVGLAGNIGKSWAGQLVEQDHEWWVIECSSFQIEGMENFKPEIAILSNISPDHLDRYENNLDKYIAAKFKLFSKMTPDEKMILFADDTLTEKGLSEYPVNAQIFELSLQNAKSEGFFDGNNLNVRLDEILWQIPASQLPIPGVHNVLNSLSAILASRLVGLSKAEIELGLKSFKNIPHRMEQIAEIDGVTYINDSKGTNVEATAYALAAFKKPLVWIAGGVDKGNDYSKIEKIVSERVKSLICLGKENEKLKEAFQSIVKDIRETQDIKEAVSWSSEIAESGDVVLLSPACASFDLFKNYEDRGEAFAFAVDQLKPKTIS